jgi:hypothetical protein
MTKKPLWKPHMVKLSRMNAVALIKLLKFMRTAWLDGAPFLAPVEKSALGALEQELRDIVERGVTARHMHRGDDVVEDYVVIHFRKSTARRQVNSPPCIVKGKLCPWLAGTAARPGECMVNVLSDEDKPKDPPPMWCGGREV